MDDNEVDALKARLAEVEGQRAELASKLSHLVDSLKHAEACALAASRPTTQVVDREAVARLAERFWRIHPKELQDKGITRKQFYEQEMLSLLRPSEPTELCDDEGCPHYGTKHVCIVRPAEPVEAEGVGEPVAWRWRSIFNAHSYTYSHGPKEPEYHEQYINEPLYTHPPKSPEMIELLKLAYDNMFDGEAREQVRRKLFE